MIQNRDNKIIGWNSLRATHPGEHLVDFLEESGISQIELAERTGISKKAINEMVNGKNPITQNTAFRFGKVFSTSPELWINLQSSYDLALAQKEETSRLKIEAEKYAPAFRETYQELAQRGYIPACRWVQKNMVEVTQNLQHFFAVNLLEYVEKGTMAFAFRKYNHENLNQYTLAAWVQLGKIQAKSVAVQPFDKEKLKETLSAIKALSRTAWRVYVPELERLLAECGVVLVYAPRLKNAPIQGATHWVESDKVLVMLNTDNQYEDRFWFTLFHELGHVLLHGKKDVYIDFDQDGHKTDEEAEADAFAQKWLVPDVTGFYALLQKGSLQTAVKAFAEENGVSAAIVAGRITHDHATAPRIYQLMNPFLKERIVYSNLAFKT